MNERHSDFALLREFVREGRQPAFAGLVREHVDLVYGTALRKVEDCGAAEEIAQNVFSALARRYSASFITDLVNHSFARLNLGAQTAVKPIGVR